MSLLRMIFQQWHIDPQEYHLGMSWLFYCGYWWYYEGFGNIYAPLMWMVWLGGNTYLDNKWILYVLRCKKTTWPLMMVFFLQVGLGEPLHLWSRIMG